LEALRLFIRVAFLVEVVRAVYVCELLEYLWQTRPGGGTIRLLPRQLYGRPLVGSGKGAVVRAAHCHRTGCPAAVIARRTGAPYC